MKVGTDGVLLGAWAPLRESDRSILDIGTGTGVIALMMAQRAPKSEIVGVDPFGVEEARENADHSPWGDRIRFFQTTVQEFESDRKFDLIVSNPPFFVDSLKCPDAGRTEARHTVSLPFGDLCRSVLRLMAHDGHFAVILPVGESEKFRREALLKLSLVRSVDVHTTPRRAAKRRLMEFVRYDEEQPVPQIVREDLYMGTGEHEQYTEEYKRLTRDFYLKF